MSRRKKEGVTERKEEKWEERKFRADLLQIKITDDEEVEMVHDTEENEESGEKRGQTKKNWKCAVTQEKPIPCSPSMATGEEREIVDQHVLRID